MVSSTSRRAIVIGVLSGGLTALVIGVIARLTDVFAPAVRYVSQAMADLQGAWQGVIAFIRHPTDTERVVAFFGAMALPIVVVLLVLAVVDGR